MIENLNLYLNLQPIHPYQDVILIMVVLTRQLIQLLEIELLYPQFLVELVILCILYIHLNQI